MSCKCDNCGGRITGLAHIGIHVKDMSRSKAFYVDKLGMEITHDVDNGSGVNIVIVQQGSMILELIELPNQAPREAGVVDHIAFAVEDIETLVCKLIEKGIVFENNGDINTLPQLFGGIKNAWFTGPDGERLEFFEFI